MALQKLFTGQSTDGVSVPFVNADESAQSIIIAGTFSAGTLKLQARDPQNPANWVDLLGLSFTATGAFPLALPRDMSVRANLSGFTGNINVTIL